MGERTLTTLAALAAAFVVYVAADRAIIEGALLPGWTLASRILSLAATFAVFAAWLLFAASYLRVGRHHPRIDRAARIAAALLLALGLVTTVEAVLDVKMIRLVSAPIGLASLVAGFAIAIAMLRRERRRALAFLICWSPAVFGGAARMALDVVPALGAAPALVSAVFVGAGFSILLSGFLTSMDLQARERRLRRRAEEEGERFRDLTATVSDSVFETDADGIVRLATGPASAGLGLAPGASLPERLAAAGPGAAPALDAVRVALARGVPFRSVEITAAGPSGAPAHYLVSGRRSADGARLRGTVADVTEDRIRARRAADQSRMAALGQLAGGMAHELNNLLHPIINLGRRVRDRTGAATEDRRLLGILVDAGERAAELVAGVLTTVRPGSVPGKPAPVTETVRRAVEAVRPALPAGIALTIDTAPLERPLLPPGEMLQVISNLVSNAVQASSGGGTVAVTLTADADGARLSVADGGRGMDADTIRRAGDPFFTTRAAGSGTGLGLSMVFAIVRGWGGTIAIASELGRGTTVTIRIPADTGGTAEGRPR